MLWSGPYECIQIAHDAAQQLIGCSGCARSQYLQQPLFPVLFARMFMASMTPSVKITSQSPGCKITFPD